MNNLNLTTLILFLLASRRSGSDDDAGFMFWALALSAMGQGGPVLGTGSTGTSTVAGGTSSSIAPSALLLLPFLGADFGRKPREGGEEGGRPERKRGFRGLEDERLMTLMLALSAQGQTSPTSSTGSGAATAPMQIDPTTLLLFALGGREMFSGPEGLRGFRSRMKASEEREEGH